MQSILLILHVLMALALIGLILIQHGKGADAGASFGGGGSQTVFGSAGSANFLTRATALLAVVFFVTSMALAWMARQEAEGVRSFLPELETLEQQEDDVDHRRQVKSRLARWVSDFKRHGFQAPARTAGRG